MDWTKFIEKSFPGYISIARRMLRNKDDAWDVVVDSYMYLMYQRFGEDTDVSPEEIGKVGVYTVANRCRNFIRDRNRKNEKILELAMSGNYYYDNVLDGDAVEPFNVSRKERSNAGFYLDKIYGF
jgi:DNA-directed RNA polymerase specialized sigma24 family protein